MDGLFYPGGGVEDDLGPVGLRLDVSDDRYFANGAHNYLVVQFVWSGGLRIDAGRGASTARGSLLHGCAVALGEFHNLRPNRAQDIGGFLIGAVAIAIEERLGAIERCA